MISIIYDILHEAPCARGIDAAMATARAGVDESHEVTGYMGGPIELLNEESIPSTSMHTIRHIPKLVWHDGRRVKLWIARAKGNGDTKVELQPISETTQPQTP